MEIVRSIDPYIRQAWDSVLDASIAPRVLFDYELLYIKSGSCCVKVEDREYVGVPGDFFLFRPRVVHQITVEPGEMIKKIYFHFDAEHLPDSKEVPVNYCLENEVPPEQRHLFREDVLSQNMPLIADRIHLSNLNLPEWLMAKVIFLHTQSDDFLSNLEKKQLFLQLLSQLLREFQLVGASKQWKNDDVVKTAKMYLDNHLSQNIRLEELAELCGLNKAYMITVFKKNYGITPYQYHLRERIKQAQYLLRFTNRNVSEVAELMGFENLSSFINAFKRISGITPSEYRNGLSE